MTAVPRWGTVQRHVATTDLTRKRSLLPGENPASLHPGDIRHWIAVYTELLRTIPALAPAGDGGTLLRDRIEGLQQRLDFWKRRRP